MKAKNDVVKNQLHNNGCFGEKIHPEGCIHHQNVKIHRDDIEARMRRRRNDKS